MFKIINKMTIDKWQDLSVSAVCQTIQVFRRLLLFNEVFFENKSAMMKIISFVTDVSVEIRLNFVHRTQSNKFQYLIIYKITSTYWLDQLVYSAIIYINCLFNYDEIIQIIWYLFTSRIQKNIMSDVDSYIVFYKKNLLKKSALNIIKLNIVIGMIYFLFIAIQVNITIHSLDQKYKNNLISSITLNAAKYNHQLFKTIIFFNYIRDLNTVLIPNVSSWVCNQNQYLCEFSDPQLGTKYSAYYSIFQSTYQYLDQNKLMVIISKDLSNITTKLAYRFGKHNQSTPPTEQISFILTYMSSLNENKYIYRKLFIKNQTYSLQCSNLNSFATLYVCLIGTVSFDSIILNDDEIIQLPQNNKVANINQLFIKYIKDNLNNHKNKYLISQTKLKQCLLYPSSQQIISCYHNQYFHLLRFPIIIGHFTIQRPSAHFLDVQLSQTKYQTQNINYYVLPNQQFFSVRNKILYTSLQKVDITIKILSLIIIVWLLSLEYSNRYIKTQVYPRIQEVNRLADQIQSKDNIISCQEELQRINNEHTFLKSIIANFRILIWYRKIAKNLSSNQKKEQLLRGLQLLDPFKYQATLKYIYVQLINLQRQTIVKNKKIRSIISSRDDHQGSICSKTILQVFNQNFLKKTTVNLPSRGMKVKRFKQQQVLDDQYPHYKISQVAEEKKIEESVIIQQLKNKNKAKLGVRFSNQDQFREMQQRKSRFAVEQSQSTVKHSIKSIESQAKNKELLQSNHQKQDKNQQFTNKNFISISNHQDSFQPIIRFNQKRQSVDKESEHQQYLSLQVLQKKTTQSIAMDISISYKKMMQYLTALINIQKPQLNPNVINYKNNISHIYQLETQKLRILYKMYKHNINYQINSDISEYLKFEELKKFQNTYDVDNLQLSKSTLYKMKIQRISQVPIYYRQLDDLCKFQDPFIRYQARHLFSQQIRKISPHLDLEVILQVYDNILQNQTTAKYKQKSLKVLIDTLKSMGNFTEQIQTLQMIRRFYNYKDKKFYFIVQKGEKFDTFTPLLKKLYQMMNAYDLIKIHHLNTQQLGEIHYDDQPQTFIKPICFQDFHRQFSNNAFEVSVIKSRPSTKTLNKKISYQKQFNNILTKIENDKSQFSKYLVILLGGDYCISASMTEQAQSSSLQQRQFYQAIHGDIIKKMQKNYFHVILVGQNLSNSQTKDVRLKKHARNSYDLLQVDLAKKIPSIYIKELQKFLSK